MKKRLRPIPKFADEAAERKFWESPKNNSTEHVDWRKAWTKMTVDKVKEIIQFQMRDDPGTVNDHGITLQRALCRPGESP